MAERYYPHLTATGPAPSMREVMDTYRAAWDVRVAAHEIRPFILPYHIYGMSLMIAYLCIDHRKRPWLRHMRWVVLGLIMWMQWKTLVECGSMSMAIAFGSGLTAIWGMVWAWTWLVFKSPQWSAKRVQRRKIKPGQARTPRRLSVQKDEVGSPGPTYRLGSPDEIESPSGTEEQSEALSGGETATSEAAPSETPDTPESNTSPEPAEKEESTLRQRKKTETKQAEASPIATTEDVRIPGAMNDGYEYYWEPYPETVRDRLAWLTDLVCNFRGPGWNWGISVLPPIPAPIRLEIGEPITPASKTLISHIGLRSFMTRKELFMYRWKRFVAGYFALDLLKVIMQKDPYYTFGPTTYELPWYLKDLHWTVLRFYRQSISTYAVLISLEMVFLLIPITMCLILGPSVLGLRGEAWYYATSWGSWSNVMNRGLNGLWGSWWHQTFRFAFSAPSNYLIKKGYIQPHTLKERLLSIFFAFAISGVLHSGGSVSQFPYTLPLQAFIFFMVQGAGVLIQTTFCQVFRPQIKQLSKPARQWGNFTFTFIWLLFTGFWLCDDFARGGMWLYEPIPISPLRAMGLGDKGDWWWCWEHIGVGWYKGVHWWESGIHF